MKIAVIGANGQLGSGICSAFSGRHEVLELTHDDIEISDGKNVLNVLGRMRPDLIVNTAADHVVPECEKNAGKAFQVNGLGALNLAQAASELGCKIAHFSTDYVFDGVTKQPYIESDKPNPLNVYAATKLAGEYFTLNYCARSFVIRVSGIYGKVPCRAKGGNFITTMVKAAAERPEVKVVNDEVLTPTPVSAIAGNTLSLVETEEFGLYHMTCEGCCSWYEFALAIFETMKLKTPLSACSVSDFPSPVKRPFYSVLENDRLKRIGLNQMPPWREALMAFIEENYQ
ncbi:MAG: dTDP-4-dehydrorhamnose reductase [Actinobacteria bacterium]|nr:dTDP-4-dehydrorhamnose reductase [Actinomycetota bacterium]